MTLRSLVGGVAACVAVLVLAGAARGADITVELLRFGVGSHVRPGDSTGMLVRLTSNLTEPVQTRVQWELRNADGDTALYARDVALAPGAPADRWLYGVLPMPSASALAALDMVTVIRVLQVDDGRVTRELAVQRIDGASAAEPPTGVDVLDGLIGVVGDGRAGLAPLAQAPGAGMRAGVPSMNETTFIARGIDAATLPDRWEGLVSYEALVWGNAAVQNLGPEQARALTDWVRRGGHLVILLPESGDPWGLLAGRGGRTPLASVLPLGGVVRHDGVAVRTLMPLLSKTPELRNPAARTSIWEFDTAAVGNGYEPVLALPCAVDLRTGNPSPAPGSLEGRTVAVRSMLGFGAITVVGIDADGLERRQLNEDGLPQADVFWNRLLGRRADAPSARQWHLIEAAKRLEPAPRTAELQGGALIQTFIGMPGQVAIGILGLILAFGIYWLAAGPGVYYTLKGMRKVQYAWLGFVVVAAVATLIAWAIAGVGEFSSGRVRHLTYLDRIEAPQANAETRALVRAQTWFSAELPGYGPTSIELEHDDRAAGSDAIWTWFAPPAGDSAGFPDTERYLVPLAAGANYAVPSRATSAVFSGAWLGDPLGEWSRLPAPTGGALRQDVTWDDTAVPSVIVHGQLVHQLPVALTDVHILYISPWRSPAPTMASVNALAISPTPPALPNYGRIRVRTTWAPNTPLDIAAELFTPLGSTAAAPRPPAAVPATSNTDSIATYLRMTFFDRARQMTDLSGTVELPADDRLNVLNFYAMLQPPGYLLAPGETPSTDFSSAFSAERKSARFTRDLGRGVDLSLWFTRPCVIVIGTLHDDQPGAIAAPFPLRIDGREPAAEGRTIVRVIFPLPDAPGAIVPPLPAPVAAETPLP